MNQEILAAQGRIANLRLAAKKLALEIEDHRQGLRMLLVPFTAPPEYDIERIPMRAAQMAASVLQLRAIEAEIANLRDEYGIAE
ncbi:MAG: hypothetical protein LLG06_11725 [Desulfobacteraceae bacterium]|nr:hypothetical protein [Desulfobacteraceae bacterium]